MKKIIIGISALVILAAGSVTAFLIAKGKQDKLAEESAALAADYELFSISSDTLNKVEFDFGDGIYTVQLSEAGDWELVDNDEFAVSNTYVQNVCTYISDLTASKDYGVADDEKKKLYGLDNPVAITASDGKTDYTVYVGDISPTGDLYYIMTSSRDKIYSIDALYGSVLKTSRTMLKNTTLVPYTDSEIAEVELLRDGKTVYDLHFNEESGQWQLPDEYNSLTTDVTNISSMINVITRATVQTFYEEKLEDYSKYGFDKPYAQLIITGTDGKEHKFLFSYHGNNTETYTHVLYEDSGQVATFYTLDMDFIEYTPRTFIADYFCNININDINGFDYTANGKTSRFTIDSGGAISMDNLSVSGFGADAASAFTNFYNSLTFLTLSDVDINLTPEHKDPFAAVSFHLKEDGKNMNFEFVEADSESCYVFLNGEYTGGLIKKSSLTDKNAAEDFYEKLLDVIGG